MVAVASILPPLFTVLSSAFSFTANTQKTDAQTMKLYGKVQTVKETCYLAVDQGGTVIKGEKTDPSLNINDMHYRFNESGYFIEQLDYTSDQKFVQRIVYVYNGGGQVMEERVENPDGSLNHKEVVVRRDDRGNKTEAKLIYNTLSSPFKVLFTYDANNNLTETCVYHDGAVFLKFQSKYDQAGNEIENWDITAGEGTIYKYDARGNRTEETRYNQNGEMIGKKTTVYNLHNQKTEVRKYDKDGHLLFTTSYTYVLDDHQNWIRQIEYFNGKPLTMTERAIEYYP